MLAGVYGDPRWQRLAKRKVIHYGYEFDYGTRDARKSVAPMPGCVNGRAWQILPPATSANATVTKR